jgi:hypothetical protein
MEHWITIEEAPKYSISNEGRILNKTLNRIVRIKYLGGGRAYVILNRERGQSQIQLFVDELLERYFNIGESNRSLGSRYGSTYL